MRDVSQYGEAAIISDFFGDRIEKFMDVGAHAGLDNSNTLALAERGWRGVCVEPSPRVFPVLLETHRERPAVACVNAAVNTSSGFVRFWDGNGDQIGTTVETHRDAWAAKGYPFNPAAWIRAVTWDELLAAFFCPFAFVSIDTEGCNLGVLKAAPLIDMGCEMVCIERESDGEMVDYLRTIGYGKIRETPGNYLASR